MVNAFDKILRFYTSNSPVNKGKHTLVRIASARHDAGYAVTIRTKFGAAMNLELSQYVDASIYYLGAYEKPILDQIKILSEQYSLDHFLDIGANIGQHSLYASVYCGLTTWAFEADTDTFRKLERNIALNGAIDTINIENVAISDVNGFIGIVTKSTSNSGMSHITPVSKNRQLSTNIEAIRLDDFFGSKITGDRGIIKIDVEGAEGAVLRGAESILKSGKIVAAIVEIIGAHLDRFGDTTQTVYQFMQQCGFVVSETTNNKTRKSTDRNHTPDKNNVLFIRHELIGHEVVLE